jgi:hypothetical protein
LIQAAIVKVSPTATLFFSVALEVAVLKSRTFPKVLSLSQTVCLSEALLPVFVTS